jgi:DNA-binding transcriptional LysR family regulator
MRPLPFDLTDLQAFVAVVEMRGFARAAERTGISKSVLSRRVSTLEYALGAQLLVRDQRGTTPTEAGTAFHHTAAEVLSRLDQVRDDATAGIRRIAGPIRLTAPSSFGVTHLAPALATFAVAHPEVVLDVRLDDRVVDLLGGGFDLGLRIGPVPDETLVARRLAPVHAYLLGSPGYFARHGRPATPSELVGHAALEYVDAGFDQWRAAFGPTVDLSRLNVRLRSDNGEVLRSAAIAGAGLVILPSFLVAAAVDRGELEPILLDHALRETALYAVAPPGRPQLRRVRELIEHLARAFGPEPNWSMIRTQSDAAD